TVAEPQPIEDHGHGCRTHAHLLLGRPGQRIQVLRQPDLAADSRHDAQMIQSLDAHTPHDAPSRSGWGSCYQKWQKSITNRCGMWDTDKSAASLPLVGNSN